MTRSAPGLPPSWPPALARTARRPSSRASSPLRLGAGEGSAFAPAKVNLFLHVRAPGADGYHPLCSLMAFADFGDHLSLYAADALELRIHRPFARQLGRAGDNLVL